MAEAPGSGLPEVVEAQLVRGESLCQPLPRPAWVSLGRGVHGGHSHAWATLPREAEAGGTVQLQLSRLRGSA